MCFVMILVLETQISDRVTLPAPPPEDVPGAPTPPVVGAGGGEGGGRGPGDGKGTLGPGPSPSATVDKDSKHYKQGKKKIMPMNCCRFFFSFFFLSFLRYMAC